MLFTSTSFSNEAENEALVIVIYPHFFNNTRTLISEIDSIINHNASEENFFIYVSNELNPSTYVERDLLFDLMDKLSVAYGNLVPNYLFDINNIIQNKQYSELVNDEVFKVVTYAFFIPNHFLEYLSSNKRKSLARINDDYEFGVIPKEIFNQDKEVFLNLYFPENTSPKNHPQIDNVLVNLKEI